MPGPARAVVGVAGPEAETAGYATPAIVVPHGQGLTFANADPTSYFHNFVAYDKFRSSRSATWCSGYPSTRCPVFWSATISQGETTPVQGVTTLKAGEYTFFCSYHETMKGTLVIV